MKVNMRNQRAAVAAFLILVLSGCVRSLQPLYGNDDIVFDPVLLGEWIGDRETWKIKRSGVNAYRIEHADASGRPGTFTGHLFRVADSLFVDVLPVQTDICESDFYREHLVSTHSFFLVVRTDPTPQFAFLSEDWLREHLQEHPGDLRHERRGRDILITAPTADVQSFLVRHLRTKGAFELMQPWRKGGPR
jgi:hypothetical protein